LWRGDISVTDWRRTSCWTKLVKDAVEQHVIGQGLILFGQGFAQGDHVRPA
jgi:hypothetical protein